MKTTILAVAVLAMVAVPPAVIAVNSLPLPTSVQDALEDPCANENDGDPPEGLIIDENGGCKYIGNLDID